MNWTKLLADLATAGMTQTEIAAECGVSQSTISDLSRGEIKAPSFELGSKLVALHAHRAPAPGSPGKDQAAPAKRAA